MAAAGGGGGAVVVAAGGVITTGLGGAGDREGGATTGINDDLLSGGGPIGLALAGEGGMAAFTLLSMVSLPDQALGAVSSWCVGATTTAAAVKAEAVLVASTVGSTGGITVRAIAGGGLGFSA